MCMFLLFLAPIWEKIGTAYANEENVSEKISNKMYAPLF